MKKISLLMRDVFIIILVTMLLLEGGLRIFPKIIPPVLLIHFNSELRQYIAKGRFLTSEETHEYNRDDHGPPLKLMRPFSVARWHNIDKPGDFYSAKLDEIGFCNLPGTYNSASAINLITLGDSFTWCNSVRPEDTWTAHFGKLAEVSTLNLGRGGVGPYEYLQILKGYGLQKRPNIVVLSIYEGNDLRDALIYQNYRSKAGKSQKHAAAPKHRKDGIISRYSYSYNLARSVVKHLKSNTFSHDDVDFRYELNFSNYRIPFNAENTDKNEVRNARLLSSKKIDLQAFNEALKTYVELSKQYRFIPVIIYIPSAHTAYANNVVFADSNLATLMTWFSNEQRSFFEKQGKNLGYKFIDLTPSLQASAKSSGAHNLLYFRRNLHLTPHGHEIVAETLRRNFQNMHLLNADRIKRKN